MNMMMSVFCFLAIGSSYCVSPNEEVDEKVTSVPNAMAPIACRIDVETAGATRIIKAVATANQAGSGSYALMIEKTGANTARTRQRGEFSLGSGERKELAVTKINVSSSDVLAGSLSLDWDGGSTQCKVE